MNRVVRTLVVEAQPVFREGLRRILHQEPALEVVAEAASPAGGLTLIQQLGIELLILDLSHSNQDGLDLIRQLREEGLAVRIMAFTNETQKEVFEEAMDLEVRGWVLKDGSIREMRDCLRTVLSGGCYITPALSALLLQQLFGRRSVRRDTSCLDRLTQAERRVIKLVAANHTSRQIAKHLAISQRTVEAHRANISIKLNLRGAHRLLQFALENRAKL